MNINLDIQIHFTNELILQSVYSSANIDSVDFSKNINFNSQSSKDKIILNINSSSIDDNMLDSTDKLLSQLQSFLDTIKELV